MYTFQSFETSGNVQFSTLVMLAMHPEIQERLYQEISSEFSNPTKCNVTAEGLEKCVYLDMIVKETLRLFPPIPIITRSVIADTKIGNFVLPKGLQIAISIYHVQRREDIWGSDAGKFNPDNFLPHKRLERHRCSFAAFSKGLRNCIGE